MTFFLWLWWFFIPSSFSCFIFKFRSLCVLSFIYCLCPVSRLCERLYLFLMSVTCVQLSLPPLCIKVSVLPFVFVSLSCHLAFMPFPVPLVSHCMLSFDLHFFWNPFSGPFSSCFTYNEGLCVFFSPESVAPAFGTSCSPFVTNGL